MIGSSKGESPDSSVESFFNNSPTSDFPALNELRMKTLSYFKDMKKYDFSIDPRLFYPCPNCPKIYKGKYTLARHLKLECGKTPMNKCQVCGQLFTHKHRLLSHLKSLHTDLFLDHPTLS
ncbi:hypothetical protein JTB14_033821 [Gonioctena quinquepunctata]|nr:hypothetical protein JTB14_033821 [Gonioctena quinquepunctata]